MGQQQAEQATDWGAAAYHGFNTAPTFLARDYYHRGDADELADERFEARKAEVLQSTLDCLRAGLAQMPVGRAGAVPATDEQVLAALEERMSCGRFLPAAAILHAVRGDMTPLWRWIEEAFTQAGEEAADRVRWTR